VQKVGDLDIPRWLTGLLSNPECEDDHHRRPAILVDQARLPCTRRLNNGHELGVIVVIAELSLGIVDNPCEDGGSATNEIAHPGFLDHVETAVGDIVRYRVARA